MRRAALAAIVGAAAFVPCGAAHAALGLSVSPLRLTLRGASSTTILVRNPGGLPLVVAAGRAGFARTLHGGPRLRTRPGAADWLTVRPRHLRLPGHAVRELHVAARPPGGAAPGDHAAVVLLSASPPGPRRVRVLLRVGVVVLVRVPGVVVRRLQPEALTVRRRGALRLLELRLSNRGNVAEELGHSALRLVLRCHGQVVARLAADPLQLLPHSPAVAEFVYRGRLRGAVVARILRRSFRLRL